MREGNMNTTKVKKQKQKKSSLILFSTNMTASSLYRGCAWKEDCKGEQGAPGPEFATS